MSISGQNSGLHIMQGALDTLQSAVHELNADSLREMRDNTVNLIVECGILTRGVSEVDKLSESKITGKEALVEEVRKAIEEFQYTVRTEMLGLMGDKVFKFFRYLFDEMNVLNAQVNACCKLAREHHQFVFGSLEKLSSQICGEAGYKRLKTKPKPLDEWSEEEIAAAKDAIEIIKTALIEARSDAGSDSERSEIHSMLESLRLSDESLRAADYYGELRDEVMAAFMKVFDAHKSIMQALEHIYFSRQ